MGIVWTNHHPNQRFLKRTISSEIKAGPVTIKFITILIIAILSLFYLFQSNISATKSYLVKELEEKKNNIETQNEELRYEAERLKSLDKAQAEAQKKNLEEVKNIDFNVRD